MAVGLVMGIIDLEVAQVASVEVFKSSRSAIHGTD